MYATPQTTMLPQSTVPLLDIPVDEDHELALAERAALYLEKQGLDHREVVQCLIKEFELDADTAEAVATLAA
jgi:hypothetical protein